MIANRFLFQIKILCSLKVILRKTMILCDYVVNKYRNLFFNKICTFVKKIIFFTVSLIAIFQKTNAQTVTWSTPGCGTTNPNLQMVVFQGCQPSEGTKEFVHFTTGTSPWNVSDLSITGSQNSTVAPFGPCVSTGFSGNFSAAAALNTIAGCGTLFDGAPTTIPPNSKVVVVPNVAGAFTPIPYQNITAAQLAPLCGKGPIYVVGDTPVAGCTNGIFANVNPACPSNCNRNIIINFGGGCVATINYDIDDPAMPSPTAGGVNFTPGCNITGAMTNSPVDCFPKPCEIPDATVSINPASKLCANSTQQINFTLNTNAPVGSSYSWSGPQGFTSTASNPTVNPSPALSVGNHVYNLTVCVPGGCSKVTSVTVTIVDNNLVVNAGLDPTSVLCVNATQSIKLNSTVTGNVSAITYAWSSNTAPPFSSSAGPNTTHSPSPSLPVGTYTYTVTATSAGCSRAATTTVTVTNGLSFTPQPDITICGSTAQALSVTPAPSATATYTWLGPNLSATTGANVTATPNAPTLPTNVVSANYKVTVTDNGCSWSDDFNIVVFAPTSGATIPPVAPVCKGNNFNLSATGSVPTGSTYSWSGPGGFSSPAQNPLGISTTSLAAGVHVYTLSVTNGPCVTTVTTSVTVTASPTFDNIVDITVCGTGPFPQVVTPTPTGTVTYNWTGPGVSSATDATINATPTAPPSTSNYSVTVTVDGCPWVDNFKITNSSPASAAVITPVPNVCKGTPFNLNVTGAPAGSTYSWSSPNGFTSTSATNMNVPSTSLAAGTHDYTVTITNGPCTTTLTTTVTITDAPTFTPIPDLIVCGSGPFPLLVTGLPAPSAGATYAWATSTSGATIAPATSATPSATPRVNSLIPPFVQVNNYNVTVTEANGCKWVDAFTITTNPPPITANVVTPVDVCLGQEIKLTLLSGTLSPPFLPIPITNLGFPAQFVWTGPNSYSATTSSSTAPHSVTVSSSATAAMAGVYTLVASAPTISLHPSCTALPVNITVNVSLPTATTYNTTTKICKGVNVALNSLILTPTPTPAGTWAGTGVTGSNFNTSALAAGVYSVSFTPSATCVSGGATDITVSDAPDVTLSQSGTLCGSAAPYVGTINLSVADVGGTAYAWSAGVTGSGQNVTVSAPGTYTVTVTNATGCNTVKMITVISKANPVVSITGPNILCPGAPPVTLTLNNTFNTYLWDDAVPTIGNSLAITGPGTYKITVTNADGCSSEATKTVVSGTSLSPVITTNPANAKICGTGSVTLSVTGSYPSYLWSNSLGTAQTVTVSAGGTYTVTVSEPASGCTGTTSVTVTQFAAPTVTISGDLTVCPGKTATLSTTPTFSSYAWSGGVTSTSATVTATFPSAYNVVVTDVNGCTATASAIFTNFPASFPSINGTNALCVGATQPLTVGGGTFTAWNWSNNDMMNSITAGPGFYTVTVTDANNCTATASKNVVSDVVSVSIVGNLNVCQGKTTSIGASSSFNNYNWSNSQNTPSISVSTGTYTLTVTNSNNCTATATATVSEVNGANVTILGNAEFCQGAANQLSTSPNNFSSYFWSGGTNTSSNATYFPDQSGTYTVIATDGNGCTATASKSILMNNSPVPVISGSSTICAGASTTLDAGAGFSSYLWNNSSTNQTITVNLVNQYNVTVTDAKGCKGVASQNVISGGNLNFTIAGTPVFCEGKDTKLSAGAGFVSYKWNDSNNSTTADITVNQEKTYTVTVSNGACEGVASINVTKNNSVPFTISGKKSFCEGGSEELTTSTIFKDYLWSTTELGQKITVTKSGKYSVTVTNTSGCTGTQSIDVTVNANPIIAIDGLKSICDGDSTKLSVLPAQSTYIWSPNPATTKDIFAKAVGVYSVTATDANGCSGTASTSISKVNDLTPTIDAKKVFCEGDTLHLVASAGYGGYTWSNGDKTATSIITKGGTYVVTVNNGACKGRDSVTVTMNLKPVIKITKDTAVCEGNEVVLKADAGAAIYQWSNKENKPIINVDTTGNYIVTVTINGCVSRDSVKVTVNPVPKPALIAPSTICIGEIATLSLKDAYAKYEWSPSGSTKDTIQVNTPGTYKVTVTTAEGCSAVAEKKIDVQSSLMPIITGKLKICEGETTVLSVKDPYAKYEWSGAGLTTADITVNGEGTYSVTVSSASGCSGTGSVEVIKAPTPTAAISGFPIICGTKAAVLTATGGATYKWSNSILVAQNTIDAEGKYDVTVTSSDGCTAVTSVDVKKSNLTGVANDTLCKGGFKLINGKRYDEANPSGVEIFKAPIGGCDSVVTVNLSFRPEISVKLTGGKTVCGTGNTVDLNVEVTGFSDVFDLTYEDDFGVKQTVNGVKNGDKISVTPSKTSTYKITNTSIDNGVCGVTFVETKITIGSVALTAKTQNISCSGEKDGSIVVTPTTGAAPFVYKWSNSINSADNQRLSAGKYRVTVSDASGCEAVDSFNITEPTPIKAKWEAKAASCVGSKGSLIIKDVEGGAGEYSYSLDGKIFNKITSSLMTIPNVAIGDYTLTINDLNKCAWSEKVTIPAGDALSVDLGLDIDLTYGDSIVLNPKSNFDMVKFNWTPKVYLTCDSLCLFPRVKPKATTLYKFTAWDAFGCSVSDDILIIINKVRRVYVPTAFSPGNGDGNNDLFRIFLGDETVKVNYFRVYDRWGNMVYQDLDFSKAESQDINRGWNGFYKGELMNPAVFIYQAEVEFTDGEVKNYTGDVLLMKQR